MRNRGQRFFPYQLRRIMPSRSRARRAQKVFISVDMEGIGGIVGDLETDLVKAGEAYRTSRRLMTHERAPQLRDA